MHLIVVVALPDDPAFALLNIRRTCFEKYKKG
jgi:hypothetical protein